MDKGELLIYPTESSYALGCAFNDRAAIRKIMQLKGRTDDRFTVVAGSLEQVKAYFKLSPAMEVLAEQYWPAALSIVVSAKYAVRVPANKTARNLATKAAVPLLATSLNISGQPPIFDLKTLPERFHGIHTIDEGALPKQAPSTVVECFRGGYVIHRQGAVELS